MNTFQIILRESYFKCLSSGILNTFSLTLTCMTACTCARMSKKHVFENNVLKNQGRGNGRCWPSPLRMLTLAAAFQKRAAGTACMLLTSWHRVSASHTFRTVPSGRHMYGSTGGLLCGGQFYKPCIYLRHMECTWSCGIKAYIKNMRHETQAPI